MLNSLLSADGWHDAARARQTNALLWTLLWAPMTMVFLAIPAMRLALSVPLDLARELDFPDDGRRRRTRGSGRRERAHGVAARRGAAARADRAAAMVGARLQHGLALLLVEVPIGWLLVECRMADWRRIPFTCSYIPGKGFVPQMFVKGFAAYVVFTFATGLMLRASLHRPTVAVALASLFSVAAAALALRRARRARQTSLLFEDELPSDLTPLRLSAD